MYLYGRSNFPGLAHGLVLRWIYLFGDEQHDALEELVAVECSDGEIEKETVEDWARDELELLNEQN